ncbi:MAG: hypothetical protein JEZ06_07475 [Anaerolineaceae bacterium]|nr:hypothetical protein [Anaerolineaceae bacterium]
MTHDYSEDKKPTQVTRWFSWFVIGAFSVFFAEVTIGNSPTVFVDPKGILIIAPIYALHSLILASLAIRRGQGFSIYILISVGLFFGLYEAYMTKVLWIPTWEPEPFQVAGIALFATLILVLFWHLFLSFIVPLFAVEGLMLNSSILSNALPGKWRKIIRSPKFILVLAVLLGMINGSTLKEIGLTLFSSISSIAILFFLIFLWIYKSKGYQYNLEDLLPGNNEIWGLSGVLLAYYLVMGFLNRPEVIPGIKGQATIWILYILVFLLFWFSKKSYQRQVKKGLEEPLEWITSDPLLHPVAQNPKAQFLAATKMWGLFAISYTLSAAFSSLILGWANDYIMKLILLSGVFFGFFCLFKTVRFIIKGFIGGQKEL